MSLSGSRARAASPTHTSFGPSALTARRATGAACSEWVSGGQSLGLRGRLGKLDHPLERPSCEADQVLLPLRIQAFTPARYLVNHVPGEHPVDLGRLVPAKKIEECQEVMHKYCTEWECRFLTSTHGQLMDRRRPLTGKQAMALENIYRKVCEAEEQDLRGGDG